MKDKKAFPAACEGVADGHHLVPCMKRPFPTGSTETFNHEWIDCYAKDGKILQDEGTPTPCTCCIAPEPAPNACFVACI